MSFLPCSPMFQHALANAGRVSRPPVFDLLNHGLHVPGEMCFLILTRAQIIFWMGLEKPRFLIR